jgi:transcriptional regulator with XRE-family HTH domain
MRHNCLISNGCRPNFLCSQGGYLNLDVKGIFFIAATHHKTALFGHVKKPKRTTDAERAHLKSIGALMLGARRGHGSQRDIAPKVGVSQSRISRWESGRAIPNALELIRFAEACGTRPERLIEGVAMPTVEQLHMELDPKAGAIVGELVQILHERRPPAPAPGEAVA